MNRLFLDIETVPLPAAIAEEEQRGIDKDGAMFTGIDPETMKKLSCSAISARILCIGFALNAHPANVWIGKEEMVLAQFWKMANITNLFVGHNVLDFDLLFIWQRSIILGITPSREIPFVRFRNAPVFDTMQEWGKWQFGHKVSLHNLSQALGIVSPKQDGLDGSRVYEYFLSGKQIEIYDYCRRDVEAVRQVYFRITQPGLPSKTGVFDDQQAETQAAP
jgi:predicted PolB exonuclease-like 3'-5' exonuclease